MEPVLFTLLITLLMVAAVVWLVVHLIIQVLKLAFWIIKTPFRIGKTLIFDASSRPVLARRCSNRKCGTKLRESSHFCHRCGSALATQVQAYRTPAPQAFSRVA